VLFKIIRSFFQFLYSLRPPRQGPLGLQPAQGQRRFVALAASWGGHCGGRKNWKNEEGERPSVRASRCPNTQVWECPCVWAFGCLCCEMSSGWPWINFYLKGFVFAKVKRFLRPSPPQRKPFRLLGHDMGAMATRQGLSPKQWQLQKLTAFAYTCTKKPHTLLDFRFSPFFS